MTVTINLKKIITTAAGFTTTAVIATSVLPKASAQERPTKIMTVETEDGAYIQVHRDAESPLSGNVYVTDKTSADVTGAIVFPSGDVMVEMTDGSDVLGTIAD